MQTSKASQARGRRQIVVISRSSFRKRTVFMTVALVLLMVLVSLRAIDPLPVRNLRNTYFDYLQRLAPRAYTPLPVLIVDVDDASLSQLGQWPWPRDRLAAMVDRLSGMGAAVIVFDILFAEPDRLSPRNLVGNAAVRAALGDGPWVEQLAGLDNDVAFAEAIARTSVVLGVADAGEKSGSPLASKSGFVFVGQNPGEALLPLRSTTAVVPVLSSAAAGFGVVNVNPLAESDTQRDVPLVWRTKDGYMPGLAMEAIRVALGESTIVVTGPNDGMNRVDEVRVGGYVIPTLSRGLFPVHFRHEVSGQYIPAYQVLDLAMGEQLAPLLQGSIVFVGSSAGGLADIRTTPLGEGVPGVSIHAQVVEQVLLESYLTRGEAVEGGEIIVLVAMGLLVSLVLMFTGPAPSLIFGGLAAGVMLTASWYGFTRLGILFDSTFPLIGGFVAFSTLAMYQFVVSDRETRKIRRSFARYVAPSVLAEIDRMGYSIELGGKTGEVTVLFCDIRNFTPMAASMSAHDLVALLNELFTDLSEEILVQSGTIDKYIGDEIMAFWNAPLVTERHQFRACMATLNMQGAMARFNARRAQKGIDAVEIGIGLDCGQACVGNIGSRHRFNYTAIGETVNVAARTQSACKHVAYGVLVTAEVADAAPTLAFLQAGQVELKGVSERTEVYILVGDEEMAGSEAFAQLAKAYQDMLDALKVGTPDVVPLARQATTLAEQVDAQLGNFFNRCLERTADFR